MTWIALSYAPFSILTSAKMQQLFDNITAMADADAGAPNITQGGLGASAVGQGECKTATASSTTSVYDTGTSVALTGGTYSWWTAGSNALSSEMIGFGNTNESGGTLGLQNTRNSDNRPFYLDERYFQASPPYNLGDGDIPLFVFLLLDNSTGEIINSSVARDPTWAYHGPTIITPTRKYDKKSFREEWFIGDSEFTVATAPKNLISELAKGKQKLVKREFEITNEYKNSDMHIRPHPWCYNSESYFSGRTVIMVDPFCKEMKMLFDIANQEHAKEAMSIIKDSFSVDNLKLNRISPAGMPVHKLKMRSK